MNRPWRTYADKIDALSLRERAMLFVAVIAVPFFISYVMFVDPAVTRIRALSAKMAQQQMELQALTIALQALEKRRTDPDAVQATRRDQGKRRIAEIDATLNTLQSGLVPAQRMNALLQDMLTRNPRLQLVALSTMSATPLVEKHAPAEKSSANANANAGAPQPTDKPVAAASSVFKHGVQITLQGSYVDLYDYLVMLEKLPWHMFWSRASLSAEDYPRLTLTVTIYTLSLDKAWLVV
jgi:MSHA biogenesis protein MshJ